MFWMNGHDRSLLLIAKSWIASLVRWPYYGEYERRTSSPQQICRTGRRWHSFRDINGPRTKDSTRRHFLVCWANERSFRNQPNIFLRSSISLSIRVKSRQSRHSSLSFARLGMFSPPRKLFQTDLEIEKSRVIVRPHFASATRLLADTEMKGSC